MQQQQETQEQKQMKKQSEKHKAPQRHVHMRQLPHPKMNYDKSESRPDGTRSKDWTHLQSQMQQQLQASCEEQIHVPQAIQLFLRSHLQPRERSQPRSFVESDSRTSSNPVIPSHTPAVAGAPSASAFLGSDSNTSRKPLIPSVSPAVICTVSDPPEQTR